ncbi:MAG TPA: dienelactone hydrolase family protein [Bryobacteraceae bacterium]|jgi:dienelactone hydrolase
MATHLRQPPPANAYDPFAPGAFSVGVRTIEAQDSARGRQFPCEIWYPAPKQDTGDAELRDATALPGTHPLVVFSHASGHHRRGATFLCTHLSSHGYVVAAMNHSEVIAPELAPPQDETAQQRAARGQAMIDSRVPDVRFLLDHVHSAGLPALGISVDPTRIGIVGHSFGGWTALAVPGVEPAICAVVALAPGGASHPKPGILPLQLNFRWGRNVPTLYLVAENDVALPLAGMYELFQRTPATKQMFILRRADHCHFMDDPERQHEAMRTTSWPEDLSWLSREMRPIAELCSGEQAHLFARALTLCHFDAVIGRSGEARRLLDGHLEAELAARGVEAIAHKA